MTGCPDTAASANSNVCSSRTPDKARFGGRRVSKADPERPREPATEPTSVLQAAVLRLLLIEHPRKLTLGELRDRLARPGAGDDARAIDAAVAGLIDAGLAERHQGALAPSRAALRFDELPVD